MIAKIVDSRADELLGQALERLRAGKVPLAAQTDLMEAVCARGNPTQLQTLEAIEAEWQVSGDSLARYRPALDGGDPIKGQTLFERHPLLGCNSCHADGIKAFNIRDGLGAPSLRRTGEEILRSIVHPQATPYSDSLHAVPQHQVTRGLTPRCQMPKGVGDLLSRTELRDLVSYLIKLSSTTNSPGD